MIVIKASNGDGGVTIGGTVLLFDGTYEDSGSSTSTITINSNGTASGTPVTISGPSGWTWLSGGTNSDYEIYCQPTSGSVGDASASVNKWLGLSTTRLWTRKRTSAGDGTNVTMTLTIRDVATQTTQASCTITLQDD